ncbi:unnamed protein product [Arctogadus glacialis]
MLTQSKATLPSLSTKTHSREETPHFFSERLQVLKGFERCAGKQKNCTPHPKRRTPQISPQTRNRRVTAGKLFVFEATLSLPFSHHDLHRQMTCTVTRPAPSRDLHRHMTCTVTRPAPSHDLHRHETCTVTRPAPSHDLHRHETCTVTRPAPSHDLHRHETCTVTRPAPSRDLHRHETCTVT